ncbi:hypothetical protein ACHMW7_16320 [Aminobacter sp. UC22_36]|uniref:hypothetical protein n=1 Tax=Aminobacter sp. UC22_36 TaxID=3374549 RepID=UPI0037573B12
MLIALFLMSRPADAQQMCAPEAAALKDLQKRFGEFVIMRGKIPDGEVIITRSNDGSWSVVVVQKAMACLTMGGKHSEIDKGV